MAELCKQCTLDTFGEESSNLTGMVTKQQFASGLVARAICEGCGETYVDHEGNCISKCCTKKHGEFDV